MLKKLLCLIGLHKWDGDACHCFYKKLSWYDQGGFVMCRTCKDRKKVCVVCGKEQYYDRAKRRGNLDKH